ncbi:MAG: Bug family tripartite tricarboxylate transporter substrate binding protein [Burkholderiales bacterium]
MRTARLLVVALGATIASITQAQTAAPGAFPSKPIRLIVPFPPPGPTDLVARAVAQKMSVPLAQSVLVENRPGATGAIAAEYVAKAPPDGYTLLLGTGSTHAVAPAVNPKLPYDNIRDFAPIVLLTTSPNVLIVHPTLPAKNVSELIALLKANPGKYNFATTGIGGLPHLAAEMFMQMSGTRMTHVPFTGSGPALNAIMAGSVEVSIDSITASPQVHAGRVRALGITGPARIAALPDTPPIAEVLPGFSVITWVGLFAPAGTPSPILDRLAQAGKDSLQPDVTQKLHELGMFASGLTRDAFATFLREDHERWRSVARNLAVPLN